MALRQSDDTEFNDALIAHGIMAPRSKTPDPPEPEPDLAPKEPQWDEDDELLDEDDLPTSVVEAYRNARLQELKAVASKARFGSIQPISKVDYTREVTEASAQGESAEESECPATGVVCFLYKDAILESRLLGAHLQRLAALYPSTKFCSIVGDMCIEGYPDRNIPTLLIYRGGDLARQVIGLSPAVGLKGQKTKLEDVEDLLIGTRAVDPSRRLEPRDSGRDSDDGSDDDRPSRIR